MNVLSSVSRLMIRTPRVFPLLAGLALSAVVGAAACQKVPLLAPSGTVINLTIGSDTASLNSSVDVIAVLIESGQQSSGTGTGTGAATTSSVTGAGTPVHDGTLVSFTTTIGTIEPADARTSNGRVTVKLTTGSTSGTATIAAYSGGARSTTQLKIGAANAKTVTLTANPQNLPSSGGQATLTALVEDVSGNAVVGVPVVFSTTKGSLSATTVNTNSFGAATTLLTTNSAADVIATCAGIVATKVTIGVAARATITITAPTTTPSVSSPATFTIGVGASGTAIPVTNAVVNFGDGQSKTLGTLTGNQTVTHFYESAGIFDVTVSATDPDGVATSATTQTAVTSLSAVVDVTGTFTSVPATATAKVTISPSSGPVIASYDWNFGDDTKIISSTGATQVHVYTTATTTYKVTVTVHPLYGSPFDVVTYVHIL